MEPPTPKCAEPMCIVDVLLNFLGPTVGVNLEEDVPVQSHNHPLTAALPMVHTWRLALIGNLSPWLRHEKALSNVEFSTLQVAPCSYWIRRQIDSNK
eukprot:2597041-Amphidinium_carterae.1